MAATLADIQKENGIHVFPLFKDIMQEPYMELDQGFGYRGVVLRNEKTDKIQCSFCGSWLRKITSSHILKEGFKSIKDYKDKYGILYKAALQSKEISQIMSKKALANKNFLSFMGSGIGLKNKSQEKANQNSNLARKKMGFRNKKGLCDDQILSRLRIVMAITGQQPCDKDLRIYDQQLQRYLEHHFGSANKGIIHYGFIPSERIIRHYKQADLLGELRKFVMDIGRLPVSKDLKNLNHNFSTYVKYFGSWRRAKMMAGLDQLLEEVKS